MKRAIVFAHFDRDGVVDPYVVAALAAYRRVCHTLVFVTVSADTLPSELDHLVDAAVIRANVGYDFGSWKAGLGAIRGLDGFDEVVCVNDSVYGPLFDIAGPLSSSALREAEYWGMVLSAQEMPHVQSWFFAMRAAVLHSMAFKEFWRSAGEPLPKEQLIRQREIGLTELAKKDGRGIAAVFDARHSPRVQWEDIREHVSLVEPARSWRLLRKTLPWRPPCNPSELLYRRLWDAGVPFLKRRLLHTNYYGLSLPRVLADLERLSPEWHELVVSHMRRAGEPR